MKDPLPALRSPTIVCDAAALAISVGKAVQGIKGPSELLLLSPSFDIVVSFSVDYIHVCLLGVAHTMLSAWLDNVGEPYYLPPIKVKELNSRIEGIHPPCNVTRIL